VFRVGSTLGRMSRAWRAHGSARARPTPLTCPLALGDCLLWASAYCDFGGCSLARLLPPSTARHKSYHTRQYHSAVLLRQSKPSQDGDLAAVEIVGCGACLIFCLRYDFRSRTAIHSLARWAHTAHHLPIRGLLVSLWRLPRVRARDVRRTFCQKC